ncbi:MAG: branched-chain amino acid ABC transporter permease [Candidatus Hodarchaeota archaeon]
MKNLSKIMQNEFLEEHRYLLIGLISLFTFFLVCPFLTQETSETALQVVFLGIVLGSVYMVFALGFTLIYGVAKQLKLSVGGYYVVGAFTMFFLLETVKIAPNSDKLKDFDGTLLLALALLPIILIVALLVYFWTLFDIRGFILVLSSTTVAGGSIILIGGNTYIVEGLYAALALLTLVLAAWYLELPKREVAFGTFILGVIVPFLVILDLPVEYSALAILSVMFTALLAVVSDRYILEHFRASHVNTMIVTVALAFLFQSIIQIVYFPEGGAKLTRFGPEKRTMRAIMPKTDTTNIFGALVENIRLVSLALAILVLIFLYLFIHFTKMGMALRAVSQDEEAAALAGIDVRKITATASGIGMGLIALAAVFASPFAAKPMWSPYMGWWVLIMAIAVVTVGGMGSLPGSTTAAFIIGYSEILIASFPEFAKFSVVTPLIVVLLVLIFKPEGLLGEKEELEA